MIGAYENNLIIIVQFIIILTVMNKYIGLFRIEIILNSINFNPIFHQFKYLKTKLVVNRYHLIKILLYILLD